jgi:hypothetical protein
MGKMIALRVYIVAFVCALCVMLAGLELRSPAASPAPVPTPGAGNAQPLSQPTPVNPVQFVVTPGQTGSSAAQNSNFYKLYSDISPIFAALNGCTYIPGAAIGSITVTAPLQVALGTCSSNTGTGVNAALSLFGPLPANVPGGSASYAPAAYYNGAPVASTAHIAIGTCTFSASNGCTVSLTGTNAFASGLTYACHADFGSGSYASTSSVGLSIYAKSATSFVIYNMGISGPTTISTSVAYECSGY